MRCPRCRRDTLRCLVSLEVEIPGAMIRRVNKCALRAKASKLMGAIWERAVVFCAHPGCGHSVRGT